MVMIFPVGRVDVVRGARPKVIGFSRHFELSFYHITPACAQPWSISELLELRQPSRSS